MKNFLFLSIIFIFQTHLVFADNTLGNSTYSPDEEIKKWATEIVAETLTFDYKNYIDRIRSQTPNYTTKGWETFTKDLQKSRTIEMIEHNKLTIKSFPFDPAIICNTEEDESSYSWYIIAPIRSIYYDNEKKSKIKKNVLIQVKETKSNKNKKPIRAIEQWLGSEDHVKPTCKLYENAMEMQTLNEAPELYIDTAEQGNVISQFTLARIYAQQKNLKKAFYWYKKAAEQGHSKAQEKLAFFYISGKVVKKDREEAKKWLQKAANQGNTSAKSSLELFSD